MALVQSDIVLADGAVYQVESGETVNNATVNSGGSMLILAGGTATAATVNSGGWIYVSGGGTALNITENGGYVFVENGANITFAPNIINELSLDNASATVHSGTTAVNATVYFYGELIVSSGGTATDTNINSRGSMFVSNGGSASGTTVNYDGTFYVESGGAATGATVNSGGHLKVRGGTANGTTISGGSMVVSSGGTANNTTVNSGAKLYIDSGGTANCTTVISYGELSVAGTVNSTAVINYGRMTVFSGGKANDTTVDGGRVKVSSGGTANNASVNIGGLLIVESGGSAVEIKENGGAVSSAYGADVTFVPNTISGLTLNNAGATVHSGTTAVNITLINSGSLAICGGIANKTIVNYWGGLYVSSGGTANSTTINRGGSLQVWRGGTANCTTIDCGVLSIDYRGQAYGVTVNSGGYLYVHNGGTVTGKLTFEEGAVVSMYEGAVMDFDLAQAGETALVNDLSVIQGAPLYTLTVDDDLKPGNYVYALADGTAEFTGTISVVNKAGDEFGSFTVGETVKAGYDSYTLNLNEGALSVTVEAPDLTPTAPVGTFEKVTWETTVAEQYVVEYSTDGFEHVIRVVTTGNAVDMPELPAGTYQWREKADANSEWAVGEAIVSEPEPDPAPKVVQAVEDGNDDLFFATTNGAWSDIYFAMHVGSVNDWTGTKDMISASGKGRIQNLFFGSADPNVLCLTDAENGDAIFVDDVYTDLPEEVEKNTARLYKIREIRAGAGDDIVDMTSQRFEYVGGGLTIRGGDGDDVIWANKGDNLLFGDAGKDRIVGASGNDVIVGGTGDDSMHGGGGNDVFAFCDNWGADTVQQAETGTVTLWFAEGSIDNWNAETLTYSDGENTVTVSGVSVEQITLKFGDDGSAQFAALSGIGAFDAFTSRKVFEESGTGILARL